MTPKIYSVITGSGSYIPTRRIPNDDFLKHVFYEQDGKKIDKPNEEIIRKFEDITGIKERRYVTDDQVASDIAFLAAKEAIASANIDGETLDYIILAHNFGDIRPGNRRSDMVPALASRVKHHLGIANPYTIPYDLPFGCAGWLEGVIQANYYIRSGDAQRILVVGADTLSRIADPHDRDGMIYADGAGAVVIEARESTQPVGILSHCTQSYTKELAFILHMHRSSDPAHAENNLYLKMQGRKLYEHALKIVPQVVRESIERAGLTVHDIKKLLIHQANNKMDEAILKRLFELYGVHHIPAHTMPMTISWLGNTSVATLPTLYDLFRRGKLENHTIDAGSNLLFAAVGAGININSVVYKVPENVT